MMPYLTTADRMQEDNMDSDHASLSARSRRYGDESSSGRRFWRFDPTVSTGTLLTVIVMIIGAVTAYASYREDRAQMRTDIDLLKYQSVNDETTMKGTINDVRLDIKEMKTDITEIKQGMAVMNATSKQRNQATN
jgi:hypothetical protein